MNLRKSTPAYPEYNEVLPTLNTSKSMGDDKNKTSFSSITIAHSKSAQDKYNANEDTNNILGKKIITLFEDLIGQFKGIYSLFASRTTHINPITSQLTEEKNKYELEFNKLYEVKEERRKKTQIKNILAKLFEITELNNLLPDISNKSSETDSRQPATDASDTIKMICKSYISEYMSKPDNQTLKEEWNRIVLEPRKINEKINKYMC